MSSLREWINLVESAHLTSSKAFQRWFAGSKIVDGQGQPLRLFRGMYGLHSMGLDKMEPREGYAAFFSDSPHLASTYANPDMEPFGESPDNVGAVFPVYIKATTLREFPSRLVAGRRTWDMFAFDDAARRLRPGEAIVVRGVVDAGPRNSTKADPEAKWGRPSDVYAIGKGTSVKSAVANSGAFADDGPMTEGGGL